MFIFLEIEGFFWKRKKTEVWKSNKRKEESELQKKNFKLKRPTLFRSTDPRDREV